MLIKKYRIYSFLITAFLFSVPAFSIDPITFALRNGFLLKLKGSIDSSKCTATLLSSPSRPPNTPLLEQMHELTLVSQGPSCEVAFELLAQDFMGNYFGKCAELEIEDFEFFDSFDLEISQDTFDLMARWLSQRVVLKNGDKFHHSIVVKNTVVKNTVKNFIQVELNEEPDSFEENPGFVNEDQMEEIVHEGKAYNLSEAFEDAFDRILPITGSTRYLNVREIGGHVAKPRFRKFKKGAISDGRGKVIFE